MMKLAFTLVAASALSPATAVWSPPAPEQGQELMSLWVSIANEAAFMQEEIRLGRNEAQCKEDCNTRKEKDDDINRGRCQKNCEQIEDKDGFSGDKKSRNSSDSGCREFTNGGRRSDRCKDANDAGKKNDDDDDDDDDKKKSKRSGNRGINLFYKGMCGNDADDDTNFKDNFCEDIDDDLCDSPSGDIKDFCKWLESSSKSFNDDDYEEGMCDSPSSSDKDFCNKIDDKLCNKSKSDLSSEEKDLCKWLEDDLEVGTKPKAAKTPKTPKGDKTKPKADKTLLRASVRKQ